ncbi:MAG: DNA-binding protein [Edaphobacter sp.]|nr:DNA-binding protein [Edaphobacter sp.]
MNISRSLLMRIVSCVTVILAIVAMPCVMAQSRASAWASLLDKGFRTPPATARPWVFWMWLRVKSNRAAITADLEAMHGPSRRRFRQTELWILSMVAAMPKAFPAAVSKSFPKLDIFLISRSWMRCLDRSVHSRALTGSWHGQPLSIWVQTWVQSAQILGKRCTTTQHRTRRINTLEHPLPFRDQGVGGSNPLAPTTFQSSELWFHSESVHRAVACSLSAAKNNLG